MWLRPVHGTAAASTEAQEDISTRYAATVSRSQYSVVKSAEDAEVLAAVAEGQVRNVAAAGER